MTTDWAKSVETPFINTAYPGTPAADASRAARHPARLSPSIAFLRQTPAHCRVNQSSASRATPPFLGHREPAAVIPGTAASAGSV